MDIQQIYRRITNLPTHATVWELREYMDNEPPPWPQGRGFPWIQARDGSYWLVMCSYFHTIEKATEYATNVDSFIYKHEKVTII